MTDLQQVAAGVGVVAVVMLAASAAPDWRLWRRTQRRTAAPDFTDLADAALPNEPEGLAWIDARIAAERDPARRAAWRMIRNLEDQ